MNISSIKQAHDIGICRNVLLSCRRLVEVSEKDRDRNHLDYKRHSSAEEDTYFWCEEEAITMAKSDGLSRRGHC